LLKEDFQLQPVSFVSFYVASRADIE